MALRTDSKLHRLLGKGDRYAARKVTLPTFPDRSIGLRPLSEGETAAAHEQAIRWCRDRGYFGRGDEEAAASLAAVLGTREGREAAGARSSLTGAMAVIATSELGYAIQVEELAVALCDPKTLDPLVESAAELREVLERAEVEYLAGVLEEWMRDRAPQRVHLTREQIREVVDAAKKGQTPTVTWNSCDRTTLLDCVTSMAAALGTCGGGTCSSTTPVGLAPSA